jgi:membrane-associated phospholipid phosphatase
MIEAPLIRRANQARALVLGYVAFSIVYLGSGSLHLRAPLALEPSSTDAMIPFVDWTIWIYLTQLALLPLAITLARDDFDRSRTFYAMIVATALAAVIFVAWPTQLERQTVPTVGLTGLAWSALYFSDTPNNCFPSLHAALAAIAGGALWRRRLHAPALLWPASIALATLMTKQHVVWDLAGGLLLAAAAWILTPRLVRYERTQPIRDAAGA